MSPWIASRLVDQRMDEQRTVAAARRASVAAGHDRVRPVVSIHQRISVWCGYRMINLGSRLMRPVLLRTVEV